MKLTFAAAAGLLALGACQSPTDWRPYTASHASFGEFPSLLQAPPAEPVLTEDERFVQQVACSGLFDVQASRLALTRSVSEPVRDFAQMMIDDHTRADVELRDLLKRKELSAPSAARSIQVEQLAGLSDEEFERAYLASQRVANQLAIRELEACSADEDEDEATNVDVDKLAFAQRILPMLRVHDRELDHLLQGR